MKVNLSYQTLLFDFADVVSEMQGEIILYRQKNKGKDVSKSLKRLDKLHDIMQMYGQLYFDMTQYKQKSLERELEFMSLANKIKEQEEEIVKLKKILDATE